MRAEVSAAGVLLTVRRFSPFGEPLQGGDGGTPFGYTGEQWDASAGLLYLRARYYSPGVGRFVSEDLFAGYKGNPKSLNRYVYATNNAVNFTDHSGLCVDCPGDPIVNLYPVRFVSGDPLRSVSNYTSDPLQALTDYYLKLSAILATNSVSQSCESLLEAGNYRDAFKGESEIILLAKMLWSETSIRYRSENIEKILIATAFVAKNRLFYGYEGTRYQSLFEVIVTASQFQGPTMSSSSSQIDILCNPANIGGYQEEWALTLRATVEVYFGFVTDPTGGAKYFKDKKGLRYFSNKGMEKGPDGKWELIDPISEEDLP